MFAYDDGLRIEITSLEFTSKGPTYKGTIAITGTNFGTDATKLSVILFNENKNYQCVVVSATDTEIVAYLRGGMPGIYSFAVNK